MSERGEREKKRRGVTVGKSTLERDLENLGYKSHAARRKAGRPGAAIQLALPDESEGGKS